MIVIDEKENRKFSEIIRIGRIDFVGKKSDGRKRHEDDLKKVWIIFVHEALYYGLAF